MHIFICEYLYMIIFIHDYIFTIYMIPFIFIPHYNSSSVPDAMPPDATRRFGSFGGERGVRGGGRGGARKPDFVANPGKKKKSSKKK